MGNSSVRGFLTFSACTTGVMKESSLPVLAARTMPPSAVDRILCPVDLAGTARQSLRLAVRFADAFGAELIVVHVVETADETEWRRHEERVRAWIAPELQNAVSYREVILHGRADERVLACAEDAGASLIVLGLKRERITTRTTLGTTAERLLAEATMPIVFVRSSDHLRGRASTRVRFR
jgi:nucleotide-binding universal stress UspA family protein